MTHLVTDDSHIVILVLINVRLERRVRQVFKLSKDIYGFVK